MRILRLLSVWLLGLCLAIPIVSAGEPPRPPGVDKAAVEANSPSTDNAGGARQNPKPGLQDAGVDDAQVAAPDHMPQPVDNHRGETGQPGNAGAPDHAAAAARAKVTVTDLAEDTAAPTTDATTGGEPAAAAPPPPPAPAIVLTPELHDLQQRVRRCLAFYYYRPESAIDRSPWGVMHYVVGFGVDTQLNVGDENVNALAWLCGNNPCYGMRMLYVDKDGVGVRQGPGYQGHEGQLLSVLALSRVRKEYPLIVDDQKLTISDLVKREQSSCRAGTELTFKLIGLAHYLDSDTEWVASDGQRWDIPRLIKEEIAQPIIGVTCGGTHRLIGLAYAVNRREKAHRPVTGQWLRAQKYVAAYQEYTFHLQNRDGSFSTRWFESRGHSGDLNRYLNTTGHALEWLAFSLPKDQLTEPRMVRMVSFLTDLLWENRSFRWEIGPKGHALRALGLYDEYVFGGKPGQRAVELAEALGSRRVW